jgi:hypothetical protein
MLPIQDGEGHVQGNLQAAISKMPHTGRRCPETAFAANKVVDFLGSLNAYLHAVHSDPGKCLRARPVNQSAVCQKEDLKTEFFDESEYVEQIFPEKRLAPGYIHARRESNRESVRPLSDHLRRFFRCFPYFQKGHFAGSRLRGLVAMTAREIALPGKVPLNKKIE